MRSRLSRESPISLRLIIIVISPDGLVAAVAGEGVTHRSTFG
jgi:hypothetical protein